MELQELFVTLGLKAGEFNQGLDDAAKKAQSFGDRIKSGLGSAVQTAGLAATAGVLAVGGAIAGMGAAGVNAFVGYQQQMNEVFTLLPGITDDAMSQMSDDVQAFSREFGTLPQEVVPALYQALSAGVPPDNVFAFLETAQMAAIGGVTDLETAVDGISSTVNAYGSDVIDAGQASDLMFTAVRLGKTTFDELAASLFQVNPTAAALGVQFGDVTGALAGMTAQGVPTSVATTQLRQLLVELSKDGGKAASMFQDLSGQTFANFIATGGNMADALELMQGGAADMGVGIQDLFGSVEAGNAALALSGPNLEGYRANIEAMAGSAGATAAAYDQMDGGIGRAVERLKAFGATALLQIGEALEPLITKALDFAEGALPKIQGALDGVIAKVTPIVMAIGDFVGGLLSGEDPVGDFANLAWTLADAFGASQEQAAAVFEAVRTLGDKIAEFVTPIANAVLNFVSFKDVLMGLGLLILSMVIPAVVSLVISLAPILLTVGAVIAVVALLRNAWENNWGDIQGKTQAAWDFIRPKLEAIKDWIVNTVIPAIKDLWQKWTTEWWPAIQGKLQEAWDVIRPILEKIGTFITDTLIPTIKELYEKWTTEWWPTIQTVLENVWTIVKGIFEELGRWVNDNIVPWIEFLQKKWSEDVWPAIQEGLETAWAIIEPIWEAIRKWAAETIPPILESLKGVFETVMSGISAAVEPVKAVWDGFVSAVTDFFDWLKNKVFNFDIHLPDLPSWAVPGSPLPIHTAWAKFSEDMPEIAGEVSEGFYEIADAVDTLRDAVQVIPDAVGQMFDSIGGYLDRAGSIGGIAGGFARRFEQTVTGPMKEEIDSLGETVEKARPIFEDVFQDWDWKLGGVDDVKTLDQLLKLRARLAGRIHDMPAASSLYEQQSLATVNASINAFMERNDLNQEYIQQQERLLALEKARADMDFLKSQMDFLKLVSENADILGPGVLAGLSGLQLGVAGDPGALLDATVDIMERLVKNASFELNAGGSGSPVLNSPTPGTGGGTTYNVQNQTINGGQNIYLYGAEESELELLGVLAR